MNINKCQLVQIHNLLDWKSHLYTLEKFKEEGLIDYIGITHFHSGAYDDLIKIIKMKKFDFVQFNHSIVERQAEKKNSFVSQMIITTQLLLIGPFAGGSLFRRVKVLIYLSGRMKLNVKLGHNFFSSIFYLSMK